MIQNKIEKDSKTSLQNYAMKGLSKVSSGTGKLIEKIHLIGDNTQLDEKLIVAGYKFSQANENRTSNFIKLLSDSQTDYVAPFIENIKNINTIYNEPLKILFDSKNIYLGIWIICWFDIIGG